MAAEPSVGCCCYGVAGLDAPQGRVEAAELDDPTTTAKPMTGNLKGLWSYRIAGGYRVIADVQPGRLVIFAVEAGPRRDVYER